MGEVALVVELLEGLVSERALCGYWTDSKSESPGVWQAHVCAVLAVQSICWNKRTVMPCLSSHCFPALPLGRRDLFKAEKGFIPSKTSEREKD